MQENHTRSDLKVVAPGPLDKSGLCVVGSVFGVTGAVASGIKNPADARRIAACWNACVGVDTDLLEQNAAPFSTMRAELDTALAAVATGRRLLQEEMERANLLGEQMLAAEQQRDALLEVAKELLNSADAAVKAKAVGAHWRHHSRAIARRTIKGIEARKKP